MIGRGEMSEILHQWITRITFVASFIAVFFIGKGVVKNYQTLTVNQMIKQYASELRSGYVDNFSSLQIACAKLGYTETTITVQNTQIGSNNASDWYRDDFSSEIPHTYKLKRMDFVTITTTNGKRTLRATFIYRGFV